MTQPYMERTGEQHSQELQLELNSRLLVIDDNESMFGLYEGLFIGETEDETELDELEQLVGDETINSMFQSETGVQFQLDCVKSGEAGYEKVEGSLKSHSPYGVILLDMRMPGGWDGLETAEQIRVIDQEVRIIFVTAYMDYDIAEIRERVGMNFEFISKPFKNEQLYQMVLSQAYSWMQFHKFSSSNDISGRISSELIETREELIRARDEAERANRVKDDFLASMSHELRTPLTSIIGNSEFLMEEGACRNCASAETLETLQSIATAGRIQLALIDDILDMSKIESGKFTIEERPFNLSVLLKDLRSMFETQAQDIGVSFRIEQLNREEFLLQGDGQRIGQVLINLIGNALKFTEKGSVSLTTRTESGQIFFTVKDSGIGMAPEMMERLFSRFEQADGSITRRFGGSGLGLYISMNLAQMMGGTIEVSSEAGVGSTFELVLPYRCSHLTDRRQEDENKPRSVIGKRLKGEILVAEDTLLIQQLVRRTLEKMGLIVSVAGNGKEAIEQVKKHRFDAILMDMQMPEMDGIEATRLLRERGVTIPIIALTANVMEKHRSQFIEAGCDEFIGKPIDNSELHRVLDQYLGKRSKS